MVWVLDFDNPVNAVHVASEASLSERLRTIRRGSFGAFVLLPGHHPDSAPQLWIQINGPYAYVHFFEHVSRAHPGYQAIDMPMPDRPDEMRFITIGESEDSSGNTMPGHALCSLDASHLAALQFFRDPASMPDTISWTPL